MDIPEVAKRVLAKHLDEQSKLEADRVARCAIIMKEKFPKLHSNWGSEGIQELPSGFYPCIPEIRKLGYTVQRFEFINTWNGNFVTISIPKELL